MGFYTAEQEAENAVIFARLAAEDAVTPDEAYYDSSDDPSEVYLRFVEIKDAIEWECWKHNNPELEAEYAQLLTVNWCDGSTAEEDLID